MGLPIMKLDLKTLIILGGIAITFGGFYYGTEYRLNSLEARVEATKEKNRDLEIRVQKLSKRIKRIEK
jgi:cell division protein FtsL